MTHRDLSTPWVCDVKGCGQFATKVVGGWLCSPHAAEFREWIRAHPSWDPYKSKETPAR